MSDAAAVAKAVLGKLGLLLSDEYRLLRGVRGGVAHLRDEVEIMNAVLRMLAEADDGAVDHFVRAWTKQVRELAHDAEDCADVFVRRVSVSVPGGKAARVLRGAWHLLATLRARHRLASDIRALRARANAIGERRARYGIDGHALRPSAFFSAASSASTAVTSSSTVALVGAANTSDQLVGVEAQVKALSEKVIKSEDNNLKVFAVVGFGGLGKTTLAMEVCRRLEEEFICEAMVSVSQAFDDGKDIARLLKEILKQVTMVKRERGKGMKEEFEVGDIASMDVEELTRKVIDFLADKRYLILIDDVWTIRAWEAIRAILPENKQRSRVIVATRIETVAKACSSAITWQDNVYQVKPLDFEDSEKLFVTRIFGPNNACPKELEKAKKSILEKCGGLPLAIVSVASLLASYKSPGSIGMWDRVSNSIGYQMESNPTLERMRQLIRLSYSHLPHHLKACMLYFTIFPEDYAISKDRLLWRWTAEGLVSETRGLTLTQVAEACFDELLSRNMIKPSKVEYNGEVLECTVQDMLLEVIVSKSLEENFVTLVGNQCQGTSYDSVRRLSIQGDEPRSFVHDISMRHVRSFTTFRPEGHMKLLNRLPEFVLLRVLDMENCKDLQNFHMKHICRLFLLRFLNLSHTDVTVLPSEIGELTHLQTLSLNNTLLDGVPESVVMLLNLENVAFSNRQKWWKLLRLPLGIQKMQNLQGLARLEIRVDDAEFATEIGQLVQLQKLHVVLNFKDCHNEPVLNEIARSIGKMCSLHEFGVEDMQFSANNMTFLHHIASPPLQINYLNIGGTIDKLPCWIESLTHLTHIGLWWVNLRSDEIYGVLWKLPNLLKISLDRNCCRDKKLVARTSFKFQMLKEITFVPYGCCQQKPKVLIFEEGAMERLERLTVRFDNFSRSIVGMKNLTSLQEVELQGKRGNIALQNAVVKLKRESNDRPESRRFKVLLKYV